MFTYWAAQAGKARAAANAAAARRVANLVMFFSSGKSCGGERQRITDLSATIASRSIDEAGGADAAGFAAMARERRPCVLRGAVAEWPAVRAGRGSAAALAAYLAGFDNGREVDAIRMPPSARGRIFYNEDMSGFNFTREKMSVSEAVKRAMKNGRFGNSPALAVQSAPIPECLPGFAAENILPLVDAAVVPRIWIGNAVVTPA